MSRKSYIGVNGKAQQIDKLYIGVSGKAKSVLKGYVGVNGIAKQFYPAEDEDEPGEITPTYYTVTIQVVTNLQFSSIGGTVTGAGRYEAGSSVGLVATPKSNYQFVGWKYATSDPNYLSTNSTYTITVDQDISLIAVFISSGGGVNPNPIIKYVTESPGITLTSAGSRSYTLSHTPYSTTGYSVPITVNGVCGTSFSHSYTAGSSKSTSTYTGGGTSILLFTTAYNGNRTISVSLTDRGASLCGSLTISSIRYGYAEES